MLSPHDKNSVSHLALQRLRATDPKELSALNGAVTTWLDTLDEMKWPWSLQYFENSAFLQGNHTARFFYGGSGAGFGIQPLGGLGGGDAAVLARVADNQLIRPVENVVGMLTQARLAPRVAPNSDDPLDEDAAAISELALELFYEQPLQLPQKLKRAALLACIAGTAIAEVEYGPARVVPSTPQLAGAEDDPLASSQFADPLIPLTTDDDPDALGRGEMGDEEFEWEDDLNLRIWSPWHITVDPQATDESDLTWIARSTYEDIDWIVENYVGKERDGFIFSDADALRSAVSNCGVSTRSPLYWYTRLQDILESPQQFWGTLSPARHRYSSGGPGPNLTIFTVIDVRPSPQFPRGRTLIRAGSDIIYAGPARAWSRKYPQRWHSYSFFRWFEVEGKFMGVPLLSFLVPLQKKINSIDYLVQRNRESLAIGQWLIPTNSQVPEGYISGAPQQEIRYTDFGGNIPTRVVTPPLPEVLLVERDQLVRSIDSIAAASVTGTENISASAARAGSIFNFLREEKLRSKAPMLQDFERFIESISQNALLEIQLNMTRNQPELARRISLAARDHGPVALEIFTGASLRDHHAVKLDVASDLMRSVEADSSNALQYLQAKAGQVTPEESAAIWAAVGLGKFVKNQEDASVRRARRMISHIRSGREAAAMPMPGVDRASAMAPVFARELSSERWLSDSPEIKKRLFEMFVVYAEMAAQEAAQAMQMLAAQAQASSGKGGGQQAASQAAAASPQP